MSNIQRTVALVFGIVFLLIGLLGFVPALTPGGALLGIFMVNGVHSIVHLLFGVLGIAAAFTGYSRLYNRAGGIIYLVLALVGFIALLGVTALAPNGSNGVCWLWPFIYSCSSPKSVSVREIQ